MLEVLLVYLGIALVLNVVAFLIAYALQSDKFTDITYASTFVLIVLIALLTSSYDIVKVFYFLFVFIWGFRLGIFLLGRINFFGKDNRFDKIRNKPSRFLGFFLIQAVTSFIILIPGIMFLKGDYVFFNWISLLGSMIWLFGFLFEAVSDDQKLKFIKNKKNKNKFITTGLWRYSRHPNYFGEIMVWVGLYLFVLSSLVLKGGYDWIIGLISPLFIIVILVFFSGIPILEKSAKQKFGNKKEYKEYVKKTPILVPDFFVK